MTPEELLTEVGLRYNAGDRAGFRALLADDVVCCEPAMGLETHGADAMCDVVFARRTPFPDLTVTVVQGFAAGERVCHEIAWDSHHDGPLTLPGGRVIEPTGRAVHTPACMAVRVTGGKLAEMHHYWDALGLLAALGALGTPAAT